MTYIIDRISQIVSAALKSIINFYISRFKRNYLRKHGAIENEKIVNNIPYNSYQHHQRGVPNASHWWAPLIKAFTFKNIMKFIITQDIFMDWPTQTRAISTIHSVLREQAKVYPADTIVYPVATIHSMKSLLEKKYKYYSLEFTVSKCNLWKISKDLGALFFPLQWRQPQIDVKDGSRVPFLMVGFPISTHHLLRFVHLNNDSRKEHENKEKT